MTCATVNKELKKQGIEVKIYRGYGYYYFMPLNGMTYNVPSLYTVNLNSYTLDQIIEHVQKSINHH